MKILVVEDSPIIRNAYATYLRENSYQVDAAADGKQALLMAKGQYDIILMDIFVPHINGIDITYQLRQRKNARQPIIIGITSDTEPDRHRMCIDSGMNEVLSKPITLPGILASIQRYNLAT